MKWLCKIRHQWRFTGPLTGQHTTRLRCHRCGAIKVVAAT